MCELQSHRGPDDDGVISLGHVCLGSNRLSIIDLSRAGHMPMSDAEENLWIVYNGETYNFQTLREELVGCGHKFRSKTDTEVVLHAFKQWGEQCFARLAGMFAFAIYDQRSDSITLARDRFGKKPLYYTYDSKHLLFASEMKVLMQVGDDPKVDRQRLMEWSLYRNVDFGSPKTLIENIFSLPAGHFIHIHDGRIGAPQTILLRRIGNQCRNVRAPRSPIARGRGYGDRIFASHGCSGTPRQRCSIRSFVQWRS